MREDLEELCSEAAKEHPSLTFSRAEFLIYLSERVDVSQKVFAGDLLLAYGCVQRDPEAIRIFESEILGRLRVREDSHRKDDVLQETRLVLLVSDGSRLPKIASYRGQGPLMLWVRTVARRIALRTRRPVLDPALYIEEPSPERGPDALVSDEEDRLAFRDLFESAADQLPPFERTALYMRYFEGANLETIARVLGKSRATTARKLGHALLSLRAASEHMQNRKELLDTLSVRRILTRKS